MLLSINLLRKYEVIVDSGYCTGDAATPKTGLKARIKSGSNGLCGRRLDLASVLMLSALRRNSHCVLFTSRSFPASSVGIDVVKNVSRSTTKMVYLPSNASGLTALDDASTHARLIAVRGLRPAQTTGKLRFGKKHATGHDLRLRAKDRAVSERRRQARDHVVSEEEAEREDALRENEVYEWERELYDDVSEYGSREDYYDSMDRMAWYARHKTCFDCNGSDCGDLYRCPGRSPYADGRSMGDVWSDYGAPASNYAVSEEGCKRMFLDPVHGWSISLKTGDKRPTPSELASLLSQIW